MRASRPGLDYYRDVVPPMLTNGSLSQTLVDRALSRLLTLRFQAGLFDKFEGQTFGEIAPADRGTAAFAEVALDAAMRLEQDALGAALAARQNPDRREYQLYVHLLHSVAMLSGRRPVLPLAHCNQAGEWGEFARCSFVMRAWSVEFGSECHGWVPPPLQS